jgi:Fe-S cluster assembly scaffold protein SufB
MATQIQKILLDKPGTRNLRLSFSKEGQEKELQAIIKGEVEGDYVLNVVVEHKIGKTRGHVLIRGIAKNGARVAITGKIKIDKDAQGVDDFLDMRVLLLDDKSQATAEPQLEIEANDVKASHAAAVGQIDEEQLFYLESRGLKRSIAESLIVEGFLRL